MAVATAQFAGKSSTGHYCPECGLIYAVYAENGYICTNGHVWGHPDFASYECCKKKDEVINGLAERTAAQSEILSRRAEKKQATATERKTMPIGTGVLDYFPDALLAVAHCSYMGNEQHNPGMPLHWDRSKSTDEADAMIRHFLDRGTVDEDGVRHSAKMAWRALAILQKEIENESTNS